MVTVAVCIQPLASVTVTVYVPALSPVAVGVVCTGVVFHEYVYGAVPPVAFTVAVPLFPPLHNTFVEPATTALSTGGCVILTDAVPVQPLESVTVTV